MGEHPSFSDPFMPPGEPVPGKTYRADGWAYVDPPTKFSPDMWQLMLGIFGDGEYVVLAKTTGPDFVRGQLLVSPRGMENMEAYRKSEGKPQ